MSKFKTAHKLQFKTAPWITSEFERFRVGTCDGLYRSTEDSFDILAITNEVPHNGHFEDVLQWFEHSCTEHKRVLRILEVWNQKFKAHLIARRGFIDIGKDNVEKTFTKLLDL